MYPGPKHRWWDVRYEEEAPTEEIPVITDEMLGYKSWSQKASDLHKEGKLVPLAWLAAWLGVPVLFLPISWHFSILWLLLFPMLSIAILFVLLIPGGVQGQTELARQDALRRRNAAYGRPDETDGFESYVYWGTPNPTRGR